MTLIDANFVYNEEDDCQETDDSDSDSDANVLPENAKVLPPENDESMEEEFVPMVPPLPNDIQHPQYDNNLYKENVWKEISNDVQSPIKGCKTRWALLRTYYRRAIQQRKTTSGQASKKARKWRFEEQMQFLKTHLQERETASNLTFNEEEQESELLSVETEETESTPPVPSPATSLSPALSAVPKKLATSKKLTEMQQQGGEELFTENEQVAKESVDTSLQSINLPIKRSTAKRQHYTIKTMQWYQKPMKS
ncbi:hypothetical protein LSTR_LSTR005294 [Laodelphax striatellus]|uniref:MADF domain-containing protein n=1 Tax=Laodelphax striatellus TaxID=195883 RepID=A0A482X822_LAOST|nr:hypothetical protein LSTR_LSTR005294 [Laodelphax striatellus]